ncbi:tyramine receptor Ser-2 [Strongylocentrotus purpuratus]|uniref:G-protein coupled receptors family 1 profile domain-containing protein n=1 Tax=Strongylocentrotus purpuratus TaxID=7668 RepID=A0A7M7GFQ4_STRPU|nr:tyramine receptor Ser-2 [Strongylocentrotus purpuratus]
MTYLTNFTSFSQSVVISNMSTTDLYPPDGCGEENIRNISDIVIAMLDILLCLLAVVCNGTVVFILYKKPKLRSKSNSHLMNLVIGDFIYCLTLPLTVASCLTGGWTYGFVICQIHGFFILWAVIGIEFIFPTLAIYRLIVMSRSQNRFAEFYKSQTLFLYVVTWILAGLCALPPLIGWGSLTSCDGSPNCFLSFSDNESYVIFLIVITTIIPLFTMAFCYTKVIITVRQSSKRVQHTTNNMLSASVASLAVCEDQNTLRVPSPALPVLYTDRDFLPLPPRQNLPRSNVNQRRSSLASATGGKTRDSGRRFSLASIASSTMSNVRPSEQRLGRSLALISASYLFTWVPVLVFTLQSTFKPNTPPDFCIKMIQLFLYLHVAVNPLVYGLLTDPLRSVLSGYIRRGRLGSTHESQRWVPPSVATSSLQPKNSVKTGNSPNTVAWREKSGDPSLPNYTGQPGMKPISTGKTLVISPVSVLSASSNDESASMRAIEDHGKEINAQRITRFSESCEPVSVSDC